MNTVLVKHNVCEVHLVRVGLLPQLEQPKIKFTKLRRLSLILCNRLRTPTDVNFAELTSTHGEGKGRAKDKGAREGWREEK